MRPRWWATPTARAIGGALGAALVVAGVSSATSAPAASATTESSPSPSTSPSTAARTPTTATSATTRPPQLVDVVLPTVGLGYAVIAGGPLTVQRLASYAPDPTVAAHAWDRLKSQRGFQAVFRSWSTPGAHDGVIDVMVAFAGVTTADTFVDNERTALARTPGTVRSQVTAVPGGVRDTFLIDSPISGIEQVVTFTRGRTAVSMSFLSGSGPTNTTPLTPQTAATLAARQNTLLTASPFGAVPGSGGLFPAGATARAVLGWAAVALALVCAGAIVVLLRRRRLVAPGTPQSVAADGWAQTVSAAAPPGWPGAPSARSPGPAGVHPGQGTNVPAASGPGTTVSVPVVGAVPLGWYAEPGGGTGLRYWDGTAWTSARAVPAASDSP